MLHFRTSTRCHLVDGSTAKLKSSCSGSCSGRGCLVVGVGECGSEGFATSTRPTPQENSSAQPCPCWLPTTFQARSAQSRLQAKVSPTRHTRRTRPTLEQNSSAKPCARPTGRGSGPAARFAAIRAARTLPLPMRNKRTLFSDALLPDLFL